MRLSLTPTLGLWGVIIAVILLAFPSINREITFYDEGVYLIIAKALASGLGYVRDSLPDSPRETLYPPLFPLVLGMIWRLFPNFPDNLVVMRMLMLVAGVLFLVLSYRTLKDGLGLRHVEALSIVAIVGAHPVFVDFTTRLTAEIPYALLSMGSLYFYARFLSSNKVHHMGFAIILAALAVLTRIIGIALLGALVIHLFLLRRYRLSIVVAAFSAAVFLPLQLWNWAGQEAYIQYPLEIGINYRGYFADLVLSDWIFQLHRSLVINLGLLMINWASLVLPWVPSILGGLLVAVVIYPPLRNLRHHPFPQAHHLYCTLCVLLILIWPWPENSRFLLVLSPLLIAYFIRGVKLLLSGRLLKASSEDTIRKVMNTVMVVLVLGALGHGISDFFNKRVNYQRAVSVHSEFQSMLKWIKDNTPSNSILVGNYDPAYHLFTGRKSIRISFPDPFSIYYTKEVPQDFPMAGRLLSWFRHSSACYLIDNPMIGGREGVFYQNLIESIKRDFPSSMSQLYLGRNKSFVVYKFTGCPSEVSLS